MIARGRGSVQSLKRLKTLELYEGIEDLTSGGLIGSYSCSNIFW